jgi:hypothetical protein
VYKFSFYSTENTFHYKDKQVNGDWGNNQHTGHCKKQVDLMRGENAEFINVTVDGTYSYHLALNG